MRLIPRLLAWAINGSPAQQLVPRLHAPQLIPWSLDTRLVPRSLDTRLIPQSLAPRLIPQSLDSTYLVATTSVKTKTKTTSVKTKETTVWTVFLDFCGFLDPGGGVAITTESVHCPHLPGFVRSDVESCHGRIEPIFPQRSRCYGIFKIYCGEREGQPSKAPWSNY